MVIRPAIMSDLEGITRCARDFFAYAEYDAMGMPLCEASFQDMVTEHINGGVVLLLADGPSVRGGIAGKISPWGFNRSIKVMLELFFWVDPDVRGASSIRMLKRFEMASKALGAHQIFMVSVNTHLQDSVDNLYRRMGYDASERFFRKSLI